MRPPVFHRRFDYDRRLLPNAHLAALEGDATNVDDARKTTGLTIGQPGWGLIYFLMLAHLRPDRFNVIVETGANWGCSTIVLAQALKDSGHPGIVHTVELDPENHARAVANVAAAGLSDFVVLHHGDSRVVLGQVMKQSGPVRAALLDASHLFADVTKEFELIEHNLDPDALVIMDNTYQLAEPHEDQRVNGFLRELTRSRGGNLINLEFVSWYTPGLAIWQRTPQLDVREPA